MKRFLWILIFLFLQRSAGAQDTCGLRMTLLTCAPGAELYSTFGHTALRVQHPARGLDEVFNYGTFEFGPDFNYQFVKGKLRYFLSVESFDNFLYTYQRESRTVVEQELLLSCARKEQLLAALYTNAREENRYYRYDFLFDNCTTRAGDMVVHHAGDTVGFRNILPEKRPSFRDLIHTYLDAGHQHWSKFGIDILLGAPLDRRVTNREAMFLPDYLLKGFDSAQVGTQKLVTPPRPVLQMPSPLTENSLLTPGRVFTILFLLIGALSFVNRRGVESFLQLFDLLFFLVAGLAGVLLLFMWFGTDHQVCRNNWNLLWALPTHAVAAFLIFSSRSWIRSYFKIVCGLTLLLLLGWAFLPQDLNPALLPVAALLGLRSWKRAQKPTHESPTVPATPR